MVEKQDPRNIIWEIVRLVLTIVILIAITIPLSYFVMNRMLALSGVQNAITGFSTLSNRIDVLEENMGNIAHTQENESLETEEIGSLQNKKIVYDGDSIAESRKTNGGGYPALIAELTGCTYENFAKGGARLCSNQERHSVVDNLVHLPDDADLYCFEGGINDFWSNTPIGSVDPNNYTGEYDTATLCGAMETIFSYCLETFPGKPICFIIPHKIQKTATSHNANGDTFEDYRNAMIAVCQKYSIPYYDAFNESGLNGWNQTQSELFLTGNTEGKGDGIHPNADGYSRYYVPQLIDLFEKTIPLG